ncbi:hypothetical protein SAY86_014518 [Trapa natans]|uniref:Ribosomal protein S16 n=2 Tax=Trapa TaxID=22665 RepID=A0AAN7QQZ9_TRANT|nr:hypothetical protein SAY86_014518 [Trapa natans]
MGRIETFDARLLRHHNDLEARAKKTAPALLHRAARFSDISSSYWIPVGEQGQRKRKMVVRIRLSRFGCKNKPFYRLMAADSRSPRDGKHLEVLGYYNPLPGQDGGKRMGLNFDRVKYWLSVGAQPSDPVQRILFRAGLLPPPPMVAMGRKGGPRDTRHVDPLNGRVSTPDKPDKSAGENASVETAD